MLQIRGNADARSRPIDGAHRPQHVRSIVRQPPGRMGEIVGIAPEGAAGADRVRLFAGGGGAARRLQPVRARPRIGAERLPPAGSPLVDGHDKTVVGCRILLLIRQKKAARRGRCDGGVEDEHRDDAAVSQRARLFAIPSGDIRPADRVVCLLPYVSDRHRDAAAKLPIDADGVLVGERRPRVRVETQVDARILHA